MTSSTVGGGPGGTKVIPAGQRDCVHAIQAAPDAGTKIAIYTAVVMAMAPRLVLVLGISSRPPAPSRNWPGCGTRSPSGAAGARNGTSGSSPARGSGCSWRLRPGPARVTRRLP
jgi:hypothetical protein